mmetsp:Transcript_17960/g.30556  ORF Transcript_17960/g.30556 Transcript_17960/m.30556 type:complete len:460 (-) Transcript_17960:35-1414(-)
MLAQMEKDMSLFANDEEEQDPTVQFWLYYYLSQHHLNIGQVDEALSFVNKAIEHTPTVVELYNLKAKIMQLAGNRQQARNLANEARNLDQADRYLNAYASKFMLKNDELDKAQETMALFSKEDDNGMLNVHMMQTMWYEFHGGMAHYRLGNYRKALKFFSFIDHHLETMLDDCYDFHQYSFRKVTLTYYIQMLEWNEKIFIGRYPILCCLNILRTASKIKKNFQGKLEEVKKEYEDYKKTEEFKKWSTEFETKDEDDPIKNDPDPQGWEVMIKAVENPNSIALQIAKKVAPVNLNDPRVVAKCLKLFCETQETELALQMATALVENHSSHFKSQNALEVFKKFLTSAKLEGDLKEKAALFEKEKLPLFEKQKSSDSDIKQSMEHTHELIKSASTDSKKAPQLALDALNKDAQNFKKVSVAENTHKLLKKKGEKGEAYFKRAQELFKYSSYFEGSQCNTK